MTKYISIETTNSGVLLFPTIQFFIPTLMDSNLIMIGPGEGIPLSCVNANQQLIDNINNAIVRSAQGSYTEVVFPVTIPNGVEVLGLDFGGGGDLCQYLLTVSTNAPYPIQFTYVDEFGGFNSIEILNDGITYGPYIAECGSMQIDEIATPVDPNEVNIYQLCSFTITVSTNAPYPIQFTYIDEFGETNGVQVPNDGNSYAASGVCGSMQIDQVATPVDPNEVTIEQTSL